MRVTLGLMLAAVGVASASQDPIPGRFLVQPPVIDGVINEDAWNAAATFEGLVEQDTGSPATEGGRFWLAYDERFLYFAAQLKDSSPDKIQATEYRTNASLRGNDNVTLEIDPFGRLTDFNRFGMNARGGTSIQIAGGRAAKREWLGDFQAKGRITPTGWEVEARIPWSVMRLPASGLHDLRFNVSREFRRMQRNYQWGYTNGGRIENFGRWLAVRVPPTPPRTLKALPYLYTGYGDTENGVANAGLDFRTELTDKMDLVGAINPDFRNIENQVLSLDFSYFERIAGEARPFFLEGGQFFRTSWDSPVFASQRVGNFDTGVKAFGKLNDITDIGVLNTVDFGHENSFMGKVRRQLAERSTAEAAYVSYRSPGLSSDSGFLNAWHSVGPYNFFVQHATTQDTVEGRGDRTNSGINYFDEHLRWGVDILRISDNYFPRLGFAPERDLIGGGGRVEIPRRTNRFGMIEHSYAVSGGKYTRVDGSPYRERVSLNSSMTWKNGLDIDMGANAENFYPYRDRTVWIGIERPRGDNYRRWAVDIGGGRLADAPYFNRSLSLTYRPLSNLQLGSSFQAVDVVHETYRQAILSASYELDAFRSLSSRVVVKDGGTNGYLAYRQSGNRGAEYFVILGDPNAEKFRFSLILKAVFPIEFALSRSGDRKARPIG